MGLSAAVADAIKKVAQAVPDGTVKDAVEDKISKVVDSNFVKNTFKKGESSWLLNYNAEGYKPIAFIPATHYTLKKRWGVGLATVGAAYGGAREFAGDRKDARLSDMQADEMSNMVNISRSPNIDSYASRRDPSTHTEEEMKAIRKDTPYGLRTGNAAGDLVFALHNLKNGGK